MVTGDSVCLLLSSRGSIVLSVDEWQDALVQDDELVAVRVHS